MILKANQEVNIQQSAHWSLAGSVAGTYGVVQKAQEHFQTVSRWLGVRSVTKQKMSGLGLLGTGLGLALTAKSGLDALKRKLGLAQKKDGDPTSFQDTNTLLQILFMGVNLVRKSKKTQLLSLVAGAGLDLYDIFSNWGETSGGDGWLRLGMFAFFNTGGHNHTRLSEGFQESAAHISRFTSQIKSQHVFGSMAVLASNDAFASVGAHAVAHPVLLGGGVLAGLGAVLRRHPPSNIEIFLRNYINAVRKANDKLLSEYVENQHLYDKLRGLTLEEVTKIERKCHIIGQMGSPPKTCFDDRVSLQSLQEVLLGARCLYGNKNFTNDDYGRAMGIARETTRLLFAGKYHGNINSTATVPRMGHLLDLAEMVGFPEKRLLEIYFGYEKWPSLIGHTPDPKNWAKAFGRYLYWQRALKGMDMNDLARIVGVSEATIRNYETGEAGLINPKAIWDLEKALGLPYNSALAFLLGDSGIVRNDRPELNAEGLRKVMGDLLKRHSLKNDAVIGVTNMSRATYFRLSNGTDSVVKGSTIKPNYGIINVADLERGIRVAIARSNWRDEQIRCIELEKNRLIAEARQLLAPGQFTKEADRLELKAVQQEKEIVERLRQMDLDNLVGQYHQQLPQVGFLMRCAFGVGESLG